VSTPGALVCESPRLLLRRVTPEDAAFVLQQLNEPGWLEHIGDRGVRDLDDARRYIELRFLAPYRTLGYGMYRVETRGDGRAVGLCGLVKRDTLPEPDLGFSLLEEHWGRGYAFEAARAVMQHARATLGLARLMAIVSPGNVASRQLLEKLGFAVQGRLRVDPQEPELILYAAELRPLP
jgi:RimJ/RimL family protein N-acetyltransferase